MELDDINARHERLAGSLEKQLKYSLNNNNLIVKNKFKEIDNHIKFKFMIFQGKNNIILAMIKAYNDRQVNQKVLYYVFPYLMKHLSIFIKESIRLKYSLSDIIGLFFT